MRVNLCVNGTFRYQDYVRFYEEAGVLGTFYYAHRRSTTRRSLGLREAASHNLWPKEYALRAVFHAAPAAIASPFSTAVCDLWQRAVIRRWQACDSMEAVVGAVADKVIGFAKARGTRVLGHPVTAHPNTVERLVGAAYESLDLGPEKARVTDRERRVDEIAACDALIADSAGVAASYVASGFPTSRVSVIRPGLDLARFRPRATWEVDREVFRVVCVGIVTPRKAQHILLRAWQHLKLPKAELVLVGALGRDAGAVLRGHDGRFTHLAHVDHGSLRALLVRASAFVMPSAEDGFAQAPFEAMACGVPSIVTEAVGMSDVIRNGVNGFVVPALDPVAIASALDALYRDRDMAERMGHAAAATVHTAGSWRDYAGRVIAQHAALLGQTPNARDAA